ncbi:hypothetical protein CONPUDRAFT_160110 [Coniophora puteana RWD-64-598 SS2]|uniref:Uncharacterized protein n=1 Tax=Coniophora puteana (strain RWD-64-598) TaxID=741705 RepID=R7SEU5_CONPW|nr:uncharacterized protein CONPUDRAFT_160110 [Coniophora puteana RWD-64-598 SS2]EIW74400.1 hypothetical protein CONPUDRAFT_160110 [Coniophora puteana RWD-64-598 SS2]
MPTYIGYGWSEEFLNQWALRKGRKVTTCMDKQSNLHYDLMCELQDMLKVSIYTEIPRRNTADLYRELALLNMAVALGATPTTYEAWEYDPEYDEGPWLPVRVRNDASKEHGV